MAQPTTLNKPEIADNEIPFEEILEMVVEKGRKKEEKKSTLEQQLASTIIGQDEAVRIIAANICRKRNGFGDEDHPLVFLFLGSSGIGKTELAKQMAKQLNTDPRAFVRIDMSEYQRQHEVSKLIGSPPGYRGHDETPPFLKTLSSYPSAVVLFDEVEKAHVDILDVFLQLFDEGRITGGDGKTRDCKEAVFVMTSNLGSHEIATFVSMYEIAKEVETRAKLKELGGNIEALLADPFCETMFDIEMSKDFKRNVVRPILVGHFRRNEFLGRVSEIVYFHPFSHVQKMKLVKTQLEYWRGRMKNKHNIELVWGREVELFLMEGYEVDYGARSIKHEINRSVILKVADAFELKSVVRGESIMLTVQPACEGEERGRIKLRAKSLCSEEEYHDVE